MVFMIDNKAVTQDTVKFAIDKLNIDMTAKTTHITEIMYYEPQNMR